MSPHAPTDAAPILIFETMSLSLCRGSSRPMLGNDLPSACDPYVKVGRPPFGRRDDSGKEGRPHRDVATPWIRCRSALLLPHLERNDVGLLAVFVGPAVDRPLLAGMDVGQHRGSVRAAAVEQEAPRLRRLDLVVAQEMQLLEDQEQAGAVAAGVDAVHLAALVRVAQPVGARTRSAR